MLAAPQCAPRTARRCLLRRQGRRGDRRVAPLLAAPGPAPRGDPHDPQRRDGDGALHARCSELEGAGRGRVTLQGPRVHAREDAADAEEGLRARARGVVRC